MGLRVERKKFDFWQCFVRTVDKTLFWISRTTIYFFGTFFILPSFFEIRARIVETCYAKFLARLLKLHSTSIDKQSEEKTTFRKNIVLHTFLWLGEEKKLTSDNLVSALLTRLRFSVLELNFEIFFLQFWIFSSFSWF